MPDQYAPLFSAQCTHIETNLSLIRDYVELWAPHHEQSGSQLLGCRTAALCKWYGLRFFGLWGFEAAMLFEPMIQNELYCFRCEPFDSATWGVRLDHLDEEDPPVYESNSGKQVAGSVSQFACKTLLIDTPAFAPYSAMLPTDRNPSFLKWVAKEFSDTAFGSEYGESDVTILECFDLIATIYHELGALHLSARTVDAIDKLPIDHLDTLSKLNWKKSGDVEP